MTEQTLHITSLIQGTRSGKGISFYDRGAKCGRWAAIDDRLYAKNAENPEPVLGTCCLMAHQQGKPCALHVGVIFHALAEKYHTGQGVDFIFDYADYPVAQTGAEALRLYSGYIKRHAPDHFGRVVAVEQHFPDGNDEFKRRLMEVYGVEVSGQIDMVVDVDDAALERLQADGLPILEKGVYIVDHKTMGQLSSKFEQDYQLDDQMVHYMMAYELCFGVQVKGAIINGVVRHKTLEPKSFPKTLIHAPPANVRAALAKWFQWSASRIAEGAPNRAFCWECPHALNGMCDRGVV